MKTNPKGFTLVELLVVIGIIALLISVLMPALSTARASAQSIACAANLRTLAQSVAIYATESKGVAPPLWGYSDGVHFNRPTLYGNLSRYGIKNNRARTCPTVTARAAMPATADTYSYKYSAIVGGRQALPGNNILGSATDPNNPTYSTDRPLKLSSLARSFQTSTGMFTDSFQWGYYEGSTAPGMAQYRWTCKLQGTAPNQTVKILTDADGNKHQGIYDFSAVHFVKILPTGQVIGRNNVAYCDGSVRSVTLKYTPGSTSETNNGIIWEDTGLVPTVAP